MQIVIMGGGKIGSNLCQTLSTSENDITLIEQDPVVLERLTSQHDIIGVLGNGSSYEIQVEAKTPNADVFVAVTANDEINLIACIIAKQLGADYTIARVRNPEYASHMEEMRRALGISLMLNPDRQAASEIARLIQFPTALSVEPFAHNRVNMVEVEIPAEHELIGQNLIAFRQKSPDVLVCAVVRNGEAFIPFGSTVLQAQDRLFITGTIADLRHVYRMFASKHDRLRSILIVGGGKLTFYILGLLPAQGIAIKIIEQDIDLARELSEQFPHVHVVHGDGTDQELLEEEGISDFDCTLALTGIDEENILISLFAISQNVPRNITKVNRLRLLRVLNNPDLQSIITPHEIVATEIIRAVRALNQFDDSNMEAMYRIAQGQVEAMEFHVVQASNVCGHNLSELPIKRGILVAYIIRGRELIIPSGRDFIKSGDHVIVVTKGHAIVNIDDILE